MTACLASFFAFYQQQFSSGRKQEWENKTIFKKVGFEEREGEIKEMGVVENGNWI